MKSPATTGMFNEALLNTRSDVAAATVAMSVSVVLFFRIDKDQASAVPAVPEKQYISAIFIVPGRRMNILLVAATVTGALGSVPKKIVCPSVGLDVRAWTLIA